ncbi:hypothetical protein CR513_58158, partial [Mucuna pruriens]
MPGLPNPVTRSHACSTWLCARPSTQSGRTLACMIWPHARLPNLVVPPIPLLSLAAPVATPTDRTQAPLLLSNKFIRSTRIESNLIEMSMVELLEEMHEMIHKLNNELIAKEAKEKSLEEKCD